MYGKIEMIVCGTQIYRQPLDKYRKKIEFKNESRIRKNKKKKRIEREWEMPTIRYIQPNGFWCP